MAFTHYRHYIIIIIIIISMSNFFRAKKIPDLGTPVHRDVCVTKWKYKWHTHTHQPVRNGKKRLTTRKLRFYPRKGLTLLNLKFTEPKFHSIFGLLFHIHTHTHKTKTYQKIRDKWKQANGMKKMDEWQNKEFYIFNSVPNASCLTANHPLT